MPLQAKLFVIDDDHPSIESVELAINVWLAKNDGKIAVVGIQQQACYQPDGSIGISVMIMYMTDQQPPVPADKPS